MSAHAVTGRDTLVISRGVNPLYRQVVDECAIDIGFAPGDIQFLNNFVTLHTRREYQDWPEASRKRHLLRLWLSDPAGRPIPREQRAGESDERVSGIARNGHGEGPVRR